MKLLTEILTNQQISKAISLIIKETNTKPAEIDFSKITIQWVRGREDEKYLIYGEQKIGWL